MHHLNDSSQYTNQVARRPDPKIFYTKLLERVLVYIYYVCVLVILINYLSLFHGHLLQMQLANISSCL